MKKYIVIYFIAILIGVLLLGTVAVPVYAIADPDNPPQVNAAYVYEDCLEDGDIGVMIEYNIEYSATPNETIAESFMTVFIDVDGVTQLNTITPYPFYDNGYGHGIVWIYFSADEVIDYGLNSANSTLYKIWLVGNPMLSWPGDPPKTITSISEWYTTGTTSTLIALRVLYYADMFEMEWLLDLIESTALGNRLTATGEEYFTNAIQYLKDMAPSAFSSTEYQPEQEQLDYSTSCGGIISDGTGTVFGSPVSLTCGNNTVTVTGNGTLTIELLQGTTGNVTNGTGNVTGSPVNLVAGINTITAVVSVNGTLVIALEQNDLPSWLETGVIGTAFDLTDVATAFGMSRWMFSGIIWIILSVVICAGAYKVNAKYNPDAGLVGGGGKVILLVFDICIIAGTLLGLLHPLIAAMLFIGFGFYTGYILFFRGANV